MGFLLSGLLFSFLYTSSVLTPVQEYHINGHAQGTTYHITYYASDSVIATRQIDSILHKIDSSLSLYRSYSLVNQFNASTDGMIVDDHFRNVVNKAIDVYKETNGLFDMSIYPLTTAWGFGPVKPAALPDSLSVQQLLTCVNSSLIGWEGKKLVKKKPCVKLDPNGIAQGYSVDVLADFLENNNIHDYLVELGGEIRVKGHKPGKEKTSIGIEAPGNEEFGPDLMQKIIYIDKGAITTSGNYRQYFQNNGQRISHLLNPVTGYPVQNELISVTVYAKDAMTADAYDNALMAMGLEKAIAFIETKDDMAAFFIYKRSDGTIADTASKKFAAFFKR